MPRSCSARATGCRPVVRPTMIGWGSPVPWRMGSNLRRTTGKTLPRPRELRGLVVQTFRWAADRMGVSVVAGRRGWVGMLLVVLVLLMGGAVTGVAYGAVDQGEDRFAGQVMDRYTDDVTTAITDRITAYGEILTDLAFAVGAQTDLTRSGFDRYTAGLSTARMPGTSGVAFVVPTTDSDVAVVQQRWRARGEPRLTFTPVTGRPGHEFVVFERAFDGVDMRGTDLESSPQAVEVVAAARQRGSVTVSAPYQLLRDRALPAAQRQTSFALAAPVITGLGSDAPDVFVGWVVMGLRGQDLLSHTMLQRAHGAVQVSLADPAAADLTIAAVTPGTRVPEASLLRERVLTVGHRVLRVTLWPTTRLTALADRGMSRVTMVAGAAVTMMLAVLTAVLAGSRNLALDRVDRATQALRDDIDRREHVETQLRQREQQLQHLASHDPLTGLANRSLFTDRITDALTTRTGPAAAGCCVMFLDLDGFKDVNDRHGHAAGDTVLTAVADRLHGALRSSDTIARFGGDEFAVLLPAPITINDARTTAGRVIAAISEPIPIGDTDVTVGASVGIARQWPSSTAEQILRDADAAMYEAKTSGKNRYAEAT